MKDMSAGKNPPKEINVFVEISQGSSVKYELDKDSGVLTVDRFLHTSMVFPFNYGFVPQTKAKDGDPLDVVIVSSLAVTPGSLISVRPIGMLEMEDEAGLDNKIIAVPVTKIDPEYMQVEDIEDISDHLKQKIKHFFERYKELEPGKWVKIKDFLGKDEAEKEIQRSF
ncbi:MAG: inorganic pyrophosphatase [Candidatus Wildermuthbacteria bacterium RIFCSPHIGHO2_12_FULL_40_12]|uniref:Inorganic pyrophosphatase n=1 Tax=Candidatus Wildermuthbacteria bacterium RIFCSPHIGHO2_12_FULL_40_12 TaxID=1802457 RepID=A0A1G2RBA0_9BACT|nr:MAG: inorganic pyrophosphatase [Candidatus Wildermuthbacteria bacterium RIFCSPHIGHO2_12_FULL_40_12]